MNGARENRRDKKQIGAKVHSHRTPQVEAGRKRSRTKVVGPGWEEVCGRGEEKL